MRVKLTQIVCRAHYLREVSSSESIGLTGARTRALAAIRAICERVLGALYNRGITSATSRPLHTHTPHKQDHELQDGPNARGQSHSLQHPMQVPGHGEEHEQGQEQRDAASFGAAGASVPRIFIRMHNDVRPP